MRDWCIFSVDVRNARKLGHEPLDPPSLAGDRRTGRTYRSALRGARVWLNIPLARTRVRHKAQAPKASIASVAARQVSPLLKNYRPACLAGLQRGSRKMIALKPAAVALAVFLCAPLAAVAASGRLANRAHP